MHQRKIIRHAVAAVLSGVTSAGTRVKATRVDPNRASELPAIGVYTLNDTVDPDSAKSSPRELKHELEVTIEGWVADSIALPVDDGMDDLAEQIEAAMDADRHLGLEASDSVLTGTTMSVGALASQGGDPLVGLVTLTYTVTYRQVVGTSTPANDFLRTGATTQITGAGADNAVQDLIDQRP